MATLSSSSAFVHDEPLECWQKVWREGIAPQLSEDQLSALHTALELDDPRLMQGATTCPPALQCFSECTCECGCPIAFAAMSSGAKTVGEVEEFFARVCYHTDQHLGEQTACKWFLNWWDDSGREHVRRLLLEEIEKNLAARKVVLDKPAA